MNKKLNCYVGIPQADYCTILVSLLLQLFSEILGHVTLTLREPLVMALKPAGKVAWQVNSMMVSLLAQESQINWFQATICQSVFSPLSRFLFCSQRQFLLPCLQCTHSCCCCC